MPASLRILMPWPPMPPVRTASTLPSNTMALATAMPAPSGESMNSFTITW
jgi:hypothetical protein